MKIYLKILIFLLTCQIKAGIRDLVAESVIKNDKLNNSFSFTLIDEDEEVASLHLNEGLVTLNGSLVVLSDLNPRLETKNIYIVEKNISMFVKKKLIFNLFIPLICKVLYVITILLE